MASTDFFTRTIYTPSELNREVRLHPIHFAHSARHHVIQRTGKLKAKRSGHVATLLALIASNKT